MSSEELLESNKWNPEPTIRKNIVPDRDCFLSVHEPVLGEGPNLWVLNEAENSDFLLYLDRRHILVNRDVYPLSAFCCNGEIYFICDYQLQRVVSKLPKNFDRVWEFDDFKPIAMDCVTSAARFNFESGSGFILIGKNWQIMAVNEDFEIQQDLSLSFIPA